MGGIGEERAPEPASEALGEATWRYRHVASPRASVGHGRVNHFKSVRGLSRWAAQVVLGRARCLYGRDDRGSLLSYYMQLRLWNEGDKTSQEVERVKALLGPGLTI